MILTFYPTLLNNFNVWFYVQQTYDLVVSGHSLLELPGKLARQRVISSLWNRTSDFLVLIEQGTHAGFAGILEAREWLVSYNSWGFFLSCFGVHMCVSVKIMFSLIHSQVNLGQEITHIVHCQRLYHR